MALTGNTARNRERSVEDSRVWTSKVITTSIYAIKTLTERKLATVANYLCQTLVACSLVSHGYPSHAVVMTLIVIWLGEKSRKKTRPHDLRAKTTSL